MTVVRLSNLVKVYWNRHRRVFSVVTADDNRLCVHRTRLWLLACTFRVSDTVRDRIRAGGPRGPHAYVVGTPVTPGELEAYDRALFSAARCPGTSFAYNPYRHAGFTTSDGLLAAARLVRLGVRRGRPFCQAYEVTYAKPAATPGRRG